MYYKKYIKYKTKYINLKREMEGSGLFVTAAKKVAKIAADKLTSAAAKGKSALKDAAINAIATTLGHKKKAVVDPISKLLDDIENKIKDTKTTSEELKKYTECKQILSEIKESKITLSSDKLDEIKKIDMTDSKNLDTLHKILTNLKTVKN